MSISDGSSYSEDNSEKLPLFKNLPFGILLLVDVTVYVYYLLKEFNECLAIFTGVDNNNVNHFLNSFNYSVDENPKIMYFLSYIIPLRVVIH